MNTEDLIGRLRTAAQSATEAAQNAEAAILRASSPEARTRAVDAAQRLLKRLEGNDRPGRPLSEGRGALKSEAQILRLQGYSLGLIARTMDIPRSTIQRWTEGVLTDRKDRSGN